MKVGILGGGQLARMLVLAGRPLGLDFVVLDPASDACAGAVAEHVCAAYDDAPALDAFARRVDVVTYEFENVPVQAAQRLAERGRLAPPPEALATASDRLAEKTLFARLDMATAEFGAASTLQELEHQADRIGYPVVVKTRREGYDGKGQALVERRDDLAEAWARLGRVPVIAESWVAFERELSMIAVRDRDGVIACYPLSQNVHRGGVLRASMAVPDDPRTPLAVEYATRLLERLSYVGVVALELFDVEGRLLANEFAPRVHNSGHWTIEGAETSQFENHLRAVLGLPLGRTDVVGHVAMLNLIGETPLPEHVLAQRGAHLHLYGKRARTGRKLGHVTVRAESTRAMWRTALALRDLPGVDPESVRALETSTQPLSGVRGRPDPSV